jgi:pyridoxine/pyridoxamine 5'-phosphate oxidase
MLDSLFDEISEEWRGAYRRKSHPFKYITLTTITDQGFPRSRTVVVREINSALETIIFTDARSQKASDMMISSKACMLAYHPKQLKQIRWDGHLEPITDPVEVKRLFQKVGEKAIKDYTTTTAPGSVIKNPDEVAYISRQEAHFLPLRFVPESFEYLKLKRPNHLRARFSKISDGWQGEWLTP